MDEMKRCVCGQSLEVSRTVVVQDAVLSECQEHEWVVFSTALQEVWLMLQCVKCGAMGTVDEPTEEEWDQAFHAPSRPCRWWDDTRVTLRQRVNPPFYVVRNTGSTPCECIKRGFVLRPEEYERVPAEICRPTVVVADHERIEVLKLIRFAGGSDLCSRQFRLFLEGYEEYSGIRNSSVVHEIASRIDRMDQKGLHMSAGVVAQVLDFFAWTIADAE